MTGEFVPLILVPRFTGLVGAQSFCTAPLDVTAYRGGSVTLWRGPLLGTSPTLEAFVEGSPDGVQWYVMPLGGSGTSPGEGDAGAASIGLPFQYRWFRLRLELGGTSPAVTCWCAGSVELRLN